MEVAEPSSPTEEEEEKEHSAQLRPRPCSNPKWAERQALGVQASIGKRSEGWGEAPVLMMEPSTLGG